MKIAVIIGSTRPGRAGEAVGRWVHEVAARRGDAEFELVDLADFDLGLLNEPTIPAAANRRYEDEATRRWSATIDGFDGYVFVTPEYNHSVPAAMKNAVDLIYPEWGNKAVGFVAYGADGGVRSIEHWRGIAANLVLYAVRAQVSLSVFTDFGKDGFAPSAAREKQLTALLNQLVPLVEAVKRLRG